MENRGPGQEVLEWNNVSNLAIEHSWDIQVNSVAIFCPCPKNLPAAKLKSSIFISLTVEISRQPNIDSVLWLLVITLM